MALTITDEAINAIKESIEQQRQENSGDELPVDICLRVGVSEGGCCGLGYTLNLVDGQEEGDEVWEQGGLTVVCDPRSSVQLDRTTLDYRETPEGKGFLFDNPSATEDCCGDSSECG